MSLADHEPKPITKPGRRPRIDEILDEMSEDDRATLDRWLRDLRYSPERIATELGVEGFSIAAGSVARYRYEKLGIGERKR